MAEDLTIRVVATGTQQVAQQLQQVGDQAKRTADSVRQTTGPLRDMGRSVRELAQAVSGAAAVASVFARNNKELKRELEVVSLTLSGAATTASAFAAVLRAIAGNPILRVIAGLAAMGAAAVALVRNWEQARDAIVRLWQGLVAFLARVWEGMATSLRGLGEIMLGVFTFNLRRIQQGWDTLRGGLGQLKNVVVDLTHSIVKLVTASWEFLVKTFGKVGEGAKKTAKDTRTFADFLKVLPVEAAQAWANMAARWAAAAESVYGSLGRVKDRIVDVIRLTQADIQMALRWIAAAQSVYGQLSRVVDKVVEVPNEDFDRFQKWLRDTAEQIQRLADSLGDFVPTWDEANDPFRQMQRSLQDIAEQIDKFIELFGDFVPNVGELSDALETLFVDTFGRWAATAEDVVKGIRDAFAGFFEGVLSGARSLSEALSGLFANIANQILGLLSKLAANAFVAWLLSLFTGRPFNLFFMRLTGLPFAQGGVAPGALVPLAALQSGGIVTRPTLAAIAEGGQPEAVVPLRGGAIPVRMEGRRQEILLNLTIHNVIGDPKSLGLPGTGDLTAVVVNDISQRGPIFKAIRLAVP